MVTGLSGAYISNIETEVLASDRFQNVIKHGWFQEHEVDQLNVGEVGHEFQSDTHLAGKAKVLQQDGHSCGGETPANTNRKGYLGIDFLCNLFRGHIGDVVGGEGYRPVHHNDILVGFWECPDLVDAERLVSEGETGETERVEERGAID